MIFKKNKIIIGIILAVSAALLIFSDRRITIDQRINHYSIYLGEYKNNELAEKIKSKYSQVLIDKIRIIKINENKYQLFYGYFPSSYEAGKVAFNYFTDSLIKNYKIVFDERPTLDNYANILFVAKYLERPTVYNFNLFTKQTEIAWSRFYQQVVALNQNKNHDKAFITTITGSSQQSSFSEIRDVKFYLFRREEDADELLGELGSGVQLYTYWENEDTIKVNISYVDSTAPQNIIQKIYAYDKEGKQGATKQRKYELLKDGFPTIPKRIPMSLSPNKRYKLRTAHSGGKYYFYLNDFNNRSEELVASSRRNINDARWSDDNNYLFIITENTPGPKSKPESTGELIVINTIEKKLQRVFNGFRFENILVQGRLLLYDKQLNENKQIEIYDLFKNKNYYTITLSGGCGLNNMPN